MKLPQLFPNLSKKRLSSSSNSQPIKENTKRKVNSSNLSRPWPLRLLTIERRYSRMKMILLMLKREIPMKKKSKKRELETSLKGEDSNKRWPIDPNSKKMQML